MGLGRRPSEIGALNAPVYDLGGTFLRCGIIGDDGRVGSRSKIRIDGSGSSVEPSYIWSGVVDHVLEFERTHANRLDPGAMAVMSFPGPIENRRRALSAPTVFGQTQQLPPIAESLEAATNRPVTLINDVSAATWYLSEQTAADRFLVVTVSSGIGSKIFDRHHPLGVIDDPPFAGEIGHGVVDSSPTAPVCECGGRGHLGAISSGRGVQRFARAQAAQRGDAFEASGCFERGATATTLSNEEHLVPAARAGDAWATDVIREATRPLASAIQTVFLAFGLERVMLIGGFATTLGECYRSLVADLLIEHSKFPIVADKLDGLVELASAAEETCLEGAAILARRIAADRSS